MQLQFFYINICFKLQTALLLCAVSVGQHYGIHINLINYRSMPKETGFQTGISE